MTALVAVVAVAIVAWFAVGTIRNVKLGHEAMRWMQDGLPGIGRRTAVRWLGSSVVELTLHEAEAPFARAIVIVFLEARDLPWMWALGRLRGRRDTLIFRGVLRDPPAFELEALDPRSWSGREAAARVPPQWSRRPPDERGIEVRHGDTRSGARAGELLALAHEAGAVTRLSVRRSEPHVQLHVALPDRQQSARWFFDTVRSLAARVVDETRAAPS